MVPTVYVLSGEFITAENAPSTPLYHISKSLDTLTHKISSIQFSRVIDESKLQDDASFISSTTPDLKDEPQHLKIYNLVHPANAYHRTDIHAAFYMTNNCPSSDSVLGNMKLVPSSSPSSKKKYIPFHKPTFTALLNPASTSASSPLFPPSTPESQPATEPQVLFTAKPSRGGRVWEWVDSKGKQVIAREEGGDGKQHQHPRLVIMAGNDMMQETQDALVALWVLRLWWAVAEEKEFQNEALLEFTTPDSIVYGGMSAMTKRAGALGAFAAAGGAC
ncbi:hypothetical protein OQA88_10538 [Cercophora sp. LCS_1]